MSNDTMIIVYSIIFASLLLILLPIIDICLRINERNRQEKKEQQKAQPTANRKAATEAEHKLKAEQQEKVATENTEIKAAAKTKEALQVGKVLPEARQSKNTNTVTTLWKWRSNSIESGRLERAKHLQLFSYKNTPYIWGEFVSKQTGEIYKTSLTSCECTDFHYHKNQPCKHILALALQTGIISEDGNPLVNSTVENGQKHKSDAISKDDCYAFAGRMQRLSQAQAIEYTRQHGLAAAPVISQKTTVLVIGNNPSFTAMSKARERGLKIVTETEFYTTFN